MEQHSILQTLLRQNQWAIFQPLMDTLAAWPLYPLFEEALQTLDRSALYASNVHGEGHIERTLLHGAFCACSEGLDEADTRLLLAACSYHDVGRINDWLDTEHGHRSAQRLAELTGYSGEDLILLQAAVDAHSKKDDVLEETLRSYSPANYPRTLRLAQLLKDADGLDRVRIHDLKTEFLRRPASVDRADFALYLYGCYQAQLALDRPFAHNQALAMQLPENREGNS